MKLKTIVFILLGIGVSGIGQAQSVDEKFSRLGLNTITTAVPFLLIAPDSRGGALGDIGVSTTPDANSMHWNASKLAFVKDKSGFSLAYTPWLRNLVPDISLSYLAGYYNLNDIVTIGGSLKYFSLGDIQFTDEFGNDLRKFNPNEFSFDAALAAKLGRDVSGGFTVKYIHSNLSGGLDVQGVDTKPGNTVAADLSLYYFNDRMKLGERDIEVSAGLAISNIGGKISYSNSQNKDFLPINLRIGPSFKYKIDDVNSITISADFNKLLVPTPPIYKRDSSGQIERDGDNLVIGAGKDPDRSTPEAMFTSFYDAPGTPIVDENGNYVENDEGLYEVEKGSRFREEMAEINFGVGMEYWYDELLALRAGYFWEHASKGNRKYFTVGAGFRYSAFGLDFSYLIPAYFNQTGQQSPLQNTLRFTLLLNFGKDGAKKGGGTSSPPAEG